MKFVLVLILVGFDSSGKTMIELSHKLTNEASCNDAGFKFKNNDNIGRGNWKEFDCIGVSE